MSRITSEFGWGSTAAEVVSGHDLRGKRAIITGASAGLGIEVARALASAGAEVVLPVRDPAAIAELVEEIKAAGGTASAYELDLGDLASVERFAKSQQDEPLDLLINNAGIMACPQWETKQGFEMQIGVNHLGHFHLTKLLLPALLKAGNARVISVASAGHHWSDIDLEDPNFEHSEYDPLIAYGRSKTANALFAVELDRRYRDQGIRAFSLMPGGIQTSLGRYMTDEVRSRLGVDAEGASQYRWKTPEQGAATTVWAAVGSELEGAGGLYLEDCAEAVPHEDGKLKGVKAYALDPQTARVLWNWSETAIAQAT